MTSVRLRYVLRPREVVDRAALPILSVYREYGVVPKDSRSDNFNKTPEDITRYQEVRIGDLVVNKMKAWQGSLGVSRHHGVVSPDYLVCAIEEGFDRRFLHYLLRSETLVEQFFLRSKGVRPAQWRIYWEDLADISVSIPSLDEQRRIADFLDRQSVETDRFQRAREAQLSTLAELEAAETLESIRGVGSGAGMRPSGLAWLGEIAMGTRVSAVGYEYDVALGKMLNPGRTQGRHLRQYLRNTNVQWDRIDTSDLMLMDFPPPERARYRVLPGDLLVCEGGEPGRAAIWDGRANEIYYQKALHRVRSRGENRVRWLYYCLRAASYMNTFAAQGNLTTIAHLTGEQLKAQRFPFPDPVTQDRIIAKLDSQGRTQVALKRAVEHQASLVGERRRAMITAAVTGQMDVTTARGIDA